MRITSNIQPQAKFMGNIKVDKISNLSDHKFRDETLKVFNLETVRDWVIPVKYKVTMDTQEVKKLFEIDNTNKKDFIAASYDFWCKNLNVPEQIQPVIARAKLSEGFIIAYDIFSNSIVQNSHCKDIDLSKNDIFTLLRHEFQHFLQNMEIYRHETLGKDWLKVNQDMFAQRNKEGIKNMLMTKQIDEWGCLPGSKMMDLCYQMRNKLRQNDIKGFDKLYEPIKQSHNKSLKLLRDNIIKTKGVIKKGAKNTDLIKTYMKSFVENLNTVQKDDSIDFDVYKNIFVEKEAYALQLNCLEELEKIFE